LADALFDTLLNWGLRALLLVLGVGALLALLRWWREALREKRERWAVRVGFGMMLLTLVYGAGHFRVLRQREQIEEGRQRYARFGDPRAAELNRGELRGWILDCTGQDRNALARYGVRDGEVQRVYPLGQAGANLIGGGRDTVPRDFTVERLFAKRLRRPTSLGESLALHAAGEDLQLTLCLDATQEAGRLLAQSGYTGAVVIQEVRSGAVVAYTATGAPQDAPLGIKRYAVPGSVFKLALAALWWENGMGDVQMPCPPYVQVGNARIRNFESHEYASLEVPRGMLRVSCNTQAIIMALEMRRRLGVEPFVDGWRRFGFVPYSSADRQEDPGPFWNTGDEAWARRMTPPPVRIRVKPTTRSGRYDQFEWAQIAIGQGPVDVTPIGVSRFLQGIGNDGLMLQPTLERDRLDDQPEPRRIMSQRTADRLMEAMRLVVDSGTAVSTRPQLTNLGGWDMGGKTGTADVRRGQRPDGWFAGLIFGPDGRARYTVVVYLQRAGQGGRAPAAVAAGMTRFMAAKDRAAHQIREAD
jgi:hypothetical protein